ncbi:MAG: tetraacyldisaccharide 4'-kinase [Burkholderiales bacterium]|nr:tetraacyldisaccharide 4'-kinase [Burkholderiales bacterium]
MSAPASTPQHWQTRGPLAVLLLPVAALFAAVAAMRRYAYRCRLLRSERAGVPVIIVGNITVGGTGKTPLTLWLAQFLATQGRHPGIISRGYGAARSDPRAVPVNGTARDYGDEPCLLTRRAGCPVWVGADRAATARALRAAHPDIDVIISDDGLQHYLLARDFEIAVIDGARGLGNGWPLPAGPLREPASRLATVDAVVVNGNGESTYTHPQAIAMHLAGHEFRNLLNPQQVVQAGHFHGQNVHAIAGIGNPARFFAQLHRLGLDCTAHAFPDHHAYSAQDLQFAGADHIVMTEKDAVKCSTFATERHWALVVNVTIDEQLGTMILARLAQARHHG